ncbi:hypothetical protein [Thalassiella azotivora]
MQRRPGGPPERATRRAPAPPPYRLGRPLRQGALAGSAAGLPLALAGWATGWPDAVVVPAFLALLVAPIGLGLGLFWWVTAPLVVRATVGRTLREHGLPARPVVDTGRRDVPRYALWVGSAGALVAAWVLTSASLAGENVF